MNVARYQYDTVRKVVFFNLNITITMSTATNGFNIFGFPISSGAGTSHFPGRDNGTLKSLVGRLQATAREGRFSSTTSATSARDVHNRTVRLIRGELMRWLALIVCLLASPVLRRTVRLRPG